MKKQFITNDTYKLAVKNRFSNKETIPIFGSKEGVKYKQGEVIPTQSVLQRWLRENHNIDAWAAPYIGKNAGDYGCMLYKNKKEIIVDHELDGNSYEEATENVLYEALKLI